MTPEHEQMRKEWDELTAKALMPGGTLEDMAALIALDRRIREAGVPGFPKLR